MITSCLCKVWCTATGPRMITVQGQQHRLSHNGSSCQIQAHNLDTELPKLGLGVKNFTWFYWEPAQPQHTGRECTALCLLLRYRPVTQPKFSLYNPAKAALDARWEDIIWNVEQKTTALLQGTRIHPALEDRTEIVLLCFRRGHSSLAVPTPRTEYLWSHKFKARDPLLPFPWMNVSW